MTDRLSSSDEWTAQGATTDLPPLAEPSEISAESWRSVRMLLVILGFQGFADAIPSIAAPSIAASFHLSDAAIADLFKWLALSALGSLILAILADRTGRRRILMWSAVAVPMCSFGAATAVRISAFTEFIFALNVFLGASLASSVVMLAEILPMPRRADGQSWGGLAATLGAGLCVLLLPVLEQFELSWRWLLAVPVAGIAILPLAVSEIPESVRWLRKTNESGSPRTGPLDIFVPLYRRRAFAIIICSLLTAISSEGMNTYSFLHAVSDARLSTSLTSALTIVSGGLGMLGFPLGAWAAERFGRVPSIVTFSIVTSSAALGYYWGPPLNFNHPAMWLGIAFLLMQASINAAQVPTYAAMTELFPTVLRGTMMGWFTLTSAVGAFAAESTIESVVNPKVGIAAVTGLLGLLGIPAAILYGLVLDETRGLSLESAANEAAFYSHTN